MPKQVNLVSTLPLLFQLKGILTVKEIQYEFKISQSSVSLLLRELGPHIVRFGSTRGAKYALRRSVRKLGNQWPIYRLNDQGLLFHWASLHALHRHFWLEVKMPDQAPPGIAQHYPSGIFPGLPFFLKDLRPQGFLGRLVARRASDELKLPPDLRLWNDDDILEYLLSHGHNLPGDIVIGEEMPKQLSQHLVHIPMADKSTGVIAEDDKPNAYIRHAEEILRGEVPGSSAGGEQPKFLATVRGRNGLAREVIVKFSPPRHDASGQRWADLLIAEEHALRTLTHMGISTAKAQTIDSGDRRFLEMERFDRTPLGRLGVISLGALSDGLIDQTTTDWIATVHALHETGLITDADFSVVKLLWCFGYLIGNTDMHPGNLSFWLNPTRSFRLAPVYDMVPMFFAPRSHGEIPNLELTFNPPTLSLLNEWSTATLWASHFWNSLGDDARFSSEFHNIASQAAKAVSDFDIKLQPLKLNSSIEELMLRVNKRQQKDVIETWPINETS